MENLFLRQQNLDLNIPNNHLVIGVGGVGSWVAYFLTTVGAKKLTLVDRDVVEEHNLNRTPYTIYHIGLEKVLALKTLLEAKSPSIKVDIYNEKIENLDLSADEYDVVWDCRDQPFSTLPKQFQEKVKIVGGYDGHQITINPKPQKTVVWGTEEVRYTIDSYIIPPVIIAAILVGSMLTNTKPTKIVNTNVKTLIKNLPLLEVKSCEA